MTECSPDAGLEGQRKFPKNEVSGAQGTESNRTELNKLGREGHIAS